MKTLDAYGFLARPAERIRMLIAVLAGFWPFESRRRARKKRHHERSRLRQEFWGYE